MTNELVVAWRRCMKRREMKTKADPILSAALWTAERLEVVDWG